MSMTITAQDFEANASKALRDPNLRKAMDIIGGAMASRRVDAASALPEFEALRDEGVKIKNHVLAHIDLYLEKFEEQLTKRGGRLHWCRTPREARETILALCRSRNAKTVTKGKSMVTEEIGLNGFLEQHGIQPVETDLGEYIIQLAHEPPSHIIGPALHKTREQIAELFEDHHPDYELPDAPGVEGRAALDRPADPGDGSARRPARPLFPGRCRHHGCEFSDRRNRRHGDRHQ
jgi:Uncharacterized conserved protein containing a ferredoxin-like domain